MRYGHPRRHPRKPAGPRVGAGASPTPRRRPLLGRGRSRRLRAIPERMRRRGRGAGRCLRRRESRPDRAWASERCEVHSAGAEEPRLDATACSTQTRRRFSRRCPSVRKSPKAISIAHGSLDDPSEYTLRPEQAIAQLGRLAREQPGGAGSHPRAHAPSVGLRRDRALSPGPLEDGKLSTRRSARWVINPGGVSGNRAASASGARWRSWTSRG